MYKVPGMQGVGIKFTRMKQVTGCLKYIQELGRTLLVFIGFTRPEEILYIIQASREIAIFLNIGEQNEMDVE